MGQVVGRIDESGALFLRDQSRLSLSSLTVTNSAKQILLNICPNDYPATSIVASRDVGDSSIIDYVQDPDSTATGPPNFLLKLNEDDELTFHFTLVVRQVQQLQTQTSEDGRPASTAVDTLVNGLTFIASSNSREIDNLVTLEFHANPNLHNHSNVDLVGDYSTNGRSSVNFEYSWRWRPPKSTEDRGGGWRNTCSFVEYDARAHRLVPLASFSFWVSRTRQYLSQPSSPSPTFALSAPPRLRIPSSKSMDSRAGITEGREFEVPASPNVEVPIPLDPVKVDVYCQRPGDDISAIEDGPVFRATMKSLEQKTSSMRMRMKKVLKKAEAAHQAQTDCNESISGFMDALREASSSNANAVQPALEHYFDKIAREILSYELQNTVNLQKIIIDPLSRVYQNDIKQAEAKKRDFEEESKDYYGWVGKYLGQRQDSMKEKKKVEADTKYQAKRRNFELRRFDYSSFMQDLHGGRKEQEVLSSLTKYADAQTASYLAVAKKIEDLLPQLHALSAEVSEADKQYQFRRTEREEKRRMLEKSTTTYIEPETLSPGTGASQATSGYTNSELDIGGRPERTISQSRSAATGGIGLAIHTGTGISDVLRSPGSVGPPSFMGSPNVARFRGIRDLEERDYSSITMAEKSGSQRKEGLLWALSRPGSHVDPKGLNKQAWHKFWVVVDQGKVAEYSNWKQKLDLHMEPIDLRMASVRTARDAERRFCFEVITPQFKRVYQATSEEDMGNWIAAIKNALQGAMEGRGSKNAYTNSARSQNEGSSFRRDIGQILTGKSTSVNHGNQFSREGMSSSGVSPSAGVFRRTTVGARPAYGKKLSNDFEDSPDNLLQLLRETHPANRWCADCGSETKTEWVSINLAIILCIECSGIHRSLGTHISKVRSLTLDIRSFTTDIVELLLLVGNTVANTVWEARLDQASKLTPQSNRDQRLRFIMSKYVDKAFVDSQSPEILRWTSDEALVAATKRNDIQRMIHSLALKANPNTTDKSRSTPVIFLALVAADPVSPGAAQGSTILEGSHEVVPFPAAELLVQNGAQIPSTYPPLPLSRDAQLYLDQKCGRTTTNRDILSPLPTRSFADGDGQSQKRVSAGGRLAKSVIPER